MENQLTDIEIIKKMDEFHKTKEPTVENVFIFMREYGALILSKDKVDALKKEYGIID